MTSGTYFMLIIEMNCRFYGYVIDLHILMMVLLVGYVLGGGHFIDA